MPPDPAAPFLSRLRQATAGLDPAAPHLIGVSGGCDSMALLHGLHRLGWRRLVVCHLNHQLRGRASAADARFVAQEAKRLGCKCEVGSAEVRHLVQQQKLSVETAARQARHEFFAQCAVKFRCPRLLLAHQADDQVETVLMHLFRGAGLHGLGGMPAAAEFQLGPRRKKLVLLRPLLTFSREELASFLLVLGLSFRHDASNDSSDHLRNRVRHELLPALEGIFQRNIRPAILRLADIAAADASCLAAAAAAFPLTKKLSVKELRRQPVALQRRVIQAWLKVEKCPDISFELIESVRAMLSSDGPPRTNLPGQRQVRRRDGCFWIE